MKAGQIFTQTMPFVWAKLLLGLATVVISIVLFGILFGVASLFGTGAGFFFLLVWIGLTVTIRFFLMRYVGYLIKAGHIAVIAEAVTTGRVPDNQVAYGKNMVIRRFGAANVFFIIDKLVTGAVRQIQKGIGRLGGALGMIPGMGGITSLMQMFVNISLGYIDECCLGYVFYKKEQGAFKSAVDGVVIYAQNWKSLLANAAKTTLMVAFFTIAFTFVILLIVGFIFRFFGLPGWIAFFVSILVAIAVKSAFVDSFILCRAMVSYMGVAPATVIKVDVYKKLMGVSGKFRDLWNRGQREVADGVNGSGYKE
jgi:hypothetical protein